MYKLLLLEDDFSLVDGLMYSLKKNGFDLEVAGTIREAEKLVAGHTGFDLFLFDVTLPDGSGFVLCEKLRKAGNRTPIIFLTASDEETSVIRGLDGGGDDYITKPFKLGELLVNLVEGRAFLNGEPLELTGAEYRLLCLLLNNSGRVLTRSMILDRLWDGSGSFVDDNTLSVYIHRLREKLEKNPSCPEHLKTVRGIGYQWRE